MLWFYKRGIIVHPTQAENEYEVSMSMPRVHLAKSGKLFLISLCVAYFVGCGSSHPPVPKEEQQADAKATRPVVKNLSIIPANADELFVFSQDSGARSDKVVGYFDFQAKDEDTGYFIRDLSSNDMSYLERDYGSEDAFAKEVEATLASDIDITPTDIIFLIDTSYSVVLSKADSELIKEANKLATAIATDDQSNNVPRYRTFADKVSAIQTGSGEEPFNNISFESQSGGGTSLYQAIQLGLEDLKNSKASSMEPVLFVFTDGKENASPAEYTLETILAAINQYQIPIYIVGLGDVDVDVLNFIASSSNGRFISAQDVTDLSSVFDQILRSIPVNYTAIYRPTRRTGNIEFKFEINYSKASANIVDSFDVDAIMGVDPVMEQPVE